MGLVMVVMEMETLQSASKQVMGLVLESTTVALERKLLMVK
jgi:hypothetical protein